MDHAVEGSLQAYLDGELEGSAAAELNRHLSGCDVCASELDALRAISGRAGAALALLDTASAPMLRAQAALAAVRRGDEAQAQPAFPTVPAARGIRLGGRSFAKAAMLLLALAGAGAAAIPGSPVRRALENTIARVAQWIGGDEAPGVVAAPEAPAAPAVPAPELNSARVWPTEGRIRVILHRPAGEVDVEVRFTDSPQVSVDTEMTEGAVGFRSGGGRLEVSGMGAGRVLVQLPHDMVSATVEAGGQIYVYMQDDELRGNGPAAGVRGEAVNFRIGG